MGTIQDKTFEDFIGFTFNNVSSQELNIKRVSNGDRYDDVLFPEINDVTAEVPGMDGQYYFGSTFGPKKISISIAFDSVTEYDLRRIKQVFGNKQQGELIFDEAPYKKYMAKIESPIELSYVCFDERLVVGTVSGDGVRVDRSNGWAREQVIKNVYDSNGRTQRIYKGEGTIEFVCYFPFAKSVFKAIPDAMAQEDWVSSSKMLTESQYEKFDEYDVSDGIIKIYNAGDVATGFRLYIPGANGEITLTYSSRAGSDFTSILKISPITLIEGDIGILIDTNNGLITGVSEFSHDTNSNATYKTSGNLYNQYVDSGYFFKLEPNNFSTDGATLEITGGVNGIEIFYDYLYF